MNRTRVLNKIISEYYSKINMTTGMHDIWDEAVVDFANDILDIIEEYDNE